MIIKGLLLLSLAGCLCQRDNPNFSKIKTFSIKDETLDHTLQFMTASPHSFGTSAQENVARQITEQLEKFSLHVEAQKFEAITPSLQVSDSGPKSLTVVKKGQNLIAVTKADLEKPCMVAIGSHYDTKYFPTFDYVGANDSASSSAGVVAIMESLAAENWNEQPCGIVGIWFDGEESQLPNWNDGENNHPAKIVDHTYGSSYAVSQLKTCAPDFCMIINGQPKVLKALVLMDMIGSKNLKISMDKNAPESLRQKLEKAAKFLNLTDHLGQVPMDIDDDHIPFANKGIPAINLIDFHNIDTWHQQSDVLSSVSKESIKKASKLASYLAWQLAQ